MASNLAPQCLNQKHRNKCQEKEDTKWPQLSCLHGFTLLYWFVLQLLWVVLFSPGLPNLLVLVVYFNVGRLQCCLMLFNGCSDYFSGLLYFAGLILHIFQCHWHMQTANRWCTNILNINVYFSAIDPSWVLIIRVHDPPILIPSSGWYILVSLPPFPPPTNTVSEPASSSN